MRFKMTPIIKNKLFWTPNRQEVLRSALVVAALLALISILDATKLLDPMVVFIFAPIYLYIIKPFLIIKRGNDFKEIKQSKKNVEKVFALGDKTFTEDKLSNIAFAIAATLFVSVFVAAGLPDFDPGSPLEILPLVTPYFAFHLYCFCTDNSLSILKAFKYGKGQQIEEQYSWNNIFEDSAINSSDDDNNGMNYQGKVARGSSAFIYDD